MVVLWIFVLDKYLCNDAGSFSGSEFICIYPHFGEKSHVRQLNMLFPDI